MSRNYSSYKSVKYKELLHIHYKLNNRSLVCPLSVQHRCFMISVLTNGKKTLFSIPKTGQGKQWFSEPDHSMIDATSLDVQIGAKIRPEGVQWVHVLTISSATAMMWGHHASNWRPEFHAGFLRGIFHLLITFGSVLLWFGSVIGY